MLSFLVLISVVVFFFISVHRNRKLAEEEDKVQRKLSEMSMLQCAEDMTVNH